MAKITVLVILWILVGIMWIAEYYDRKYQGISAYLFIPIMFTIATLLLTIGLFVTRNEW